MKYLLSTVFVMTVLSVSAQNVEYEVIKHPKVEEAFTVQNMDSLHVVFQSMQKDLDTVYFQISPYTMFKIYPKGLVGTKEEE
ncbi:MAG: hypothetical protein KDC84_05940 [Crocinitomicaceae bacterium]|nr:hypothetical protein [Crocinitomicaceae bacterium]